MNDKELISKFRTELMGGAILWIMIYHMWIHTGFAPFDILCNNGFAGVDIFLFLSGFGLCFSQFKTLLEFYRKRALRILPTYWLMVFMFFLIGGEKNILDTHRWIQMFLQLSTLGYWINKGYWLWYISAIAILYLAFPYLLHIAKRYRYKGFLFFLIVALAFNIVNSYLPERMELFTNRIAVFYLGIIVGIERIYNNNENTNVKLRIIVVISFICWAIGAVMRYYNIVSQHYILISLTYIPLAVSVPLICFCSSCLYEHCNKYILYIFRYLGIYSLELYIIHSYLFNIVEGLNSSQFDKTLFSLLMIVVSIFSAPLLHFFSNKLVILLTHLIPLVSIVVPLYGVSEYIENNLCSVID